ncbi:MAG TPA: hypothetical protein VG013_08675 [Gemmataceae bacterium]|nr:hypothetical protein [Gemmataceae bacterium]
MNRLLVALAVLAAPALGYAQVGAEPGHEYDVTVAAGPWMIVVHSYRGDQAAQLAHEFVTELRTRYKLPAYVFNHGADERQKQELDLQRQRQQQKEFLASIGASPDTPLHLRKVRIEEQYAVLVGGYKDIDSAHDALEDIKQLPPPPEKFMERLGVAPIQPGPNPNAKIQANCVNPFVTSFVVHNPRLPVEDQTHKPDPAWKKLNADESYSLLKCAKSWTLVVKVFQGATVVQSHSAPTALLEKLLGQNSADYLDASAKQAHELAKVLREHPQMHYEAYVLHTRNASIVTVGGYDSPDDPQLIQSQRALANIKLLAQTGPGIQFFSTPMPMQVPRP